MKIGRRAFLAAGAVIAALGGAVVYLAKPFQARQLTAEEKQACGLTVEALEGPYFVSGMAELKEGDLNFTKLAGVPIEISGRVYDGLNAAKPLAGAAVEIWHADSDGSYHPNGNGPSTGYQTAELALRGFVLTDADGRYRFTPSIPASIPAAPATSISKFAVPASPNLQPSSSCQQSPATRSPSIATTSPKACQTASCSLLMKPHRHPKRPLISGSKTPSSIHHLSALHLPYGALF
jgi:hypothetical protein